MILIVTFLLTAVSVVTFNSLIGIVEPMTRHALEKVAASNPQFTQDMLETQLRRSMKIAPWFSLLTPIMMLVAALVIWVLGKIFGSKASYTQSLVIAAYVSIIYVVALVTGAQALVLDMTKVTNPFHLSLSAARFVDPASMSPSLYGILGSLDVFTIWRLALLAIGIRVIGKTSRGAAWGFAVLCFLVMVLMGVRNAISMAP